MADGWTLDSILGGRVRLLQPPRGYRAAIDPVLLAAAVPALPGMRVLDLGTGTGAAALCLAARVPGVHVTGIEQDPVVAAAARAGVAASGLSDWVAVLTSDLALWPAGLPMGGFNHVIANPPFLISGAATPPPDRQKRDANVEQGARLEAWVATARRALRPRGGLTLIHRADRFDYVIRALGASFGDIHLFPLWPRVGTGARRILVHARLGGRGPARIAAGLVLHEANGEYTAAAQAVLRDGQAISL